MTFCLGIRVRDGLVGIADTRIISGNECTTARKVSAYELGDGAMFVMTAGLRSIRDKVLTYFEQALQEREEPFRRLHQAVNLLAEQIRRVAEEDGAYLERSGLRFDFKALVGGQMRKEPAHQLYMVYPEGNWVGTDRGTPYHIIGAGGYGMPILVRALKYEDSMRHAVKTAYLAFDSTRISVADVDFPVDAVLYELNSFRIVEHRYEEHELHAISSLWQERLRAVLADLPGEWIEAAFSKLRQPPEADSVDG